MSRPLLDWDYSRLILDRNGQLLRVFLNNQEQYCFPPDEVDSLPEKLVTATLHFEDKYFRYHPGVNPWAMTRAAWLNIKHGRVVSGGSTITMQLARIRKNRSRNLWSKILETGEALRIESRYSKDEILQLYLDHAPYGGNVQGYQAASWRFLGKPAGELSWAEAATLAVLPNAPGYITPYTHSLLLREKRDQLLEQLWKAGEMDSLSYSLALQEDLPHKLWSFPFYAPHLTRKMDAEAHFREDRIHSTIDLSLQERTRLLAQKHMHQISNQGINNCAVLVAETGSGKVRAYLGSQNYNDLTSQGRVDGVTAPRSSGSLLKPFLYSLAVQGGILLPETQLMDIPTYYGTFSPSNASEQFAGVATAREALIHSLNVPAVRVLYTCGMFNFYNFLQEAGVSTLFRPADDYGLSLIIGGSEVTLWDMTSLYRGLGNFGAFGPLSLYEDLPRQESVPMLDSASVMLILDCIRDLRRPGIEHYWEMYNNQRPVAWKTGTSYGHKDAWALAVTPDWTVGVWVGNFSGQGNKNLAGARSAGPLLFDIINSLPSLSETRWFEIPEILYEPTELCGITGYPAGEACSEKLPGERPVNAKPMKICPYHQIIQTDREEKFEVCSYCWEEGHHSKRILFYPPGVLQHVRNKGNIVEKLPPHRIDCPKNGGYRAIEILYPKEGMKIQQARDFGGEQQALVFQAAHSHASQILYWYLDDEYLGITGGEHKMTSITSRGEHILSVRDTQGNKAQCKFSTFVSED